MQPSPLQAVIRMVGSIDFEPRPGPPPRTLRPRPPRAAAGATRRPGADSRTAKTQGKHDSKLVRISFHRLKTQDFGAERGVECGVS